MLIKFWGVRGSISAPGGATVRYGGNTPCLQLFNSRQEFFIIDAGYGIVGLGEELMKKSAGQPQSIHLLLTHLHWDHIQGLPFFVPIYIPGNQVFIHSLSEKMAREAMERLFTSVYSPIMGVENLGAHIEYVEMKNQNSLCGVEITPFPLNHRVPTWGMRFEENGKVICLATDHEGGDVPSDEVVCEAAQKSHLFVHDAQFTLDEYDRYHGWGHSHTGAAVRNALRAGAQKLILFHFDPTHTDDDVDGQLHEAAPLVRDSFLSVIAAAEKLVLEA